MDLLSPIITGRKVFPEFCSTGISGKFFAGDFLHTEHLPIDRITYGKKIIFIDFVAIRIKKRNKTDCPLFKQIFEIIDFFKLPSAFPGSCVFFYHLYQITGHISVCADHPGNAKNCLVTIPDPYCRDQSFIMRASDYLKACNLTVASCRFPHFVIKFFICTGCVVCLDHIFVPAMYEKSYLFLYQYMKRDRSKDLPLKNISYVNQISSFLRLRTTT